MVLDLERLGAVGFAPDGFDSVGFGPIHSVVLDVVCVGTSREPARGKRFLDTSVGAARGAARDLRRSAAVGLTVFMVRNTLDSFHRFSLSSRREAALLRDCCHPQGEEVQGGPARPVASFGRFGIALWASLLREPLGSRRRRGTFTGQSCQPFCQGETTKHLRWIRRVTVPLDEQGSVSHPNASDTLQSVAPTTGRNVIPPSLICPGPFRRLLPPDAGTYLFRVRDRPSERVRTRPGRIRKPFLHHVEYFLTV
jgi:hypothetical protein